MLKPNIKIILVTANCSENDIKTSFRVGADGFLTKPLSIERFANILQDVNYKGGE